MQIISTPTCCHHCKQEYPLNALKLTIIDNKEYYFCCNGCKLAFSLLKENNLESFYEKLGDNSLQTKAIQEKQNVIDYNAPSFQAQYIKQKGEYHEVCLIVEGIVCAACVWLNEKILQRLQGIHEVSINYTSYKAKILFNPHIISLQEIIHAIEAIGYKAIVYDSTKPQSLRAKIDSNTYIKIIVAIFCTMNIMWVNVGQYSGHFAGIDITSSNIMNLASFILATPTLFYCASGFYKQAYKGLKNGIIGMETLVITGTSLVYFYSIFAWLSHSGHTYFESVCMIILFVLSAKFLESLSRKKAGDNLDKLNSILPLEARLENGKVIPVHNVKKHDKLLVLPGEMLSCDGILLSEHAIFDCKNISGESEEIFKKEGELLVAGSIALHKPLIYEAKKEFKNSSMSKLARLLEQSEFSTPPIATTAFKIAGHFSRIVLSIALLGFLYYFFMAKSNFEEALLIAVSVIVIACPCALALATPLASVVGLNIGFKNHIIFTKADYLESLARADTIIFDKTGTLTQGNMQVKLIERFSALDSLSLDSATSNVIPKDALKLIAGRGFTALVHGGEILAGSEQLFQEYGIIDSMQCTQYCDLRESNLQDSHLIDSHDKSIIINLMQKNPHPIAKAILECLQADSTNFKQSPALSSSYERESLKESSTRFYLAYKPKGATQYQLAYIFYLQDSLKSEAKSLIQTLKRYKKESMILSGDRESVVSYIAKNLQIESFYANQTPDKKAQRIQELIKQGKKVVMIGDGLNDSLALKYAQVGIAMGSGSEIAIANSDVIILDSKLSTLSDAFRISHKTLQRIKENLIISLIYNVFAIPFALCGFVIPLFAAVFMSLSSITVMLNSLRQ
ncbi:heavy metal translocating P-type ATPase [Helicobacter sp. MIT 14-3879]|uniref:heavy metal translocating P-type ATPase n=1 Tax=Helicobacter sp. MIT 14-3879 TaxID=2040649 RepID=UPI000E1EDE5B|nr:heavy metal translocating P-type ATPase [Helicobacter sp. MIT 14-3879]RDU61522.1 ATPase P [Helicobacter sp. MIT 14-3879]